VEVENKAGKTVKLSVNIKSEGEGDPNVRIPVSGMNGKVFSGMTAPHLIGIMQKIDPTKPFGTFKLEVEADFAYKNKSKSNITGTDDYVASGIGTGTGSWNNDNYAQAVQSAQQSFFVTGSSLMVQGRRAGISQP